MSWIFPKSPCFLPQVLCKGLYDPLNMFFLFALHFWMDALVLDDDSLYKKIDTNKTYQYDNGDKKEQEGGNRASWYSNNPRFVQYDKDNGKKADGKKPPEYCSDLHESEGSWKRLRKVDNLFEIGLNLFPEFRTVYLVKGFFDCREI